jgi:hypothetical protein
LALSRIGKKILKIIWISAGSLIILLTAFHFWVVYHAEDILQELVESKSNGKLKLEVRNFKFNWFSRKMELQDAVFHSTDSVNAATTYSFAVRKINIKLKAFWPLVFDKQVLINNLELKDPDITVTRLRKSKDKVRDDNVSVPLEMGRIYNSIQDALEVLQVKKFELDNASFQLINKIQPDQQSIAISHIDLTIHDLKVDSSKFSGKEKLFFRDVILKSRDQDILFPDKRHRLSFRKFRINIEKKIVEFDSCTLAVVKTDNTSTGFSIFFDALVLTDIDFDTLYRAQVIKADSVYCINPVFNLTADLDKRKKGKRSSPKLDEIIRKLTGDMMLNFVIVNNASFDISTTRNGNPSSFKSQNNNFEMQGLRIDDDAKRPLKVEKFAMAIRNYENFLRDSLYALQFDSIHVNNDRIFLNNFAFQKLNNKGKPVSNFSVPRFLLTGLSWDDLLFERRLKAQEATLYDPVIDYNEVPRKIDAKAKRNVFDVLSDINDVLLLENMNIINGDIHVKLNGGIDMQLKKANMSVESRVLLGSDQLSGIRRSVNYLDFNKGILQINDLKVQLDNINYTGADSRLNAQTATVSNTSGTINATAKNIAMKEVFINEFTGDVSIGGLNWEQADIDISNALAATNEKKTGASFISLTDIIGKNTRISSVSGNKKTTAYINHVAATAFLLKPGEKPFIAGLDLSGSDLFMTGTNNQTSVERFNIVDQQKAVFENISYKNKTATDSTDISAERLSFVPDVQMAIEGELRATDMKISNPVINIHTGLKTAAAIATAFSLPKGTLDKLVIEKPVFNLSRQTEKGLLKINWDGRNTTLPPLSINNIISDGSSLSASQLDLLLNNFIFKSDNGLKISSGKAEIKTQLNDLSFQQEENKESRWQATITTATGKDFSFDSVGKKNGQLNIKSWDLKDLALSSSSTKNIRQLLAENKKTSLKQLNGNYLDASKRLDWFNVAYDKNTRFLTLDSFLYNPVLSKEEFTKAHPFQADYFRISTGSARIGAFDIDSYLADSIVRIDKMTINDIVFNDYRDMRLPFQSGIIKPLIGNRIKNIPIKLSIDTVLLNNASVTYVETNAQTKQTGTIPVSGLNLNYKNGRILCRFIIRFPSCCYYKSC